MMSIPSAMDVNVTQAKDIKLGHDQCWIVSTAALSNNRLLLAYANNPTLTLIYTHSSQLLGELSLTSTPGDLTATNKDEAVVSLPDEHKLLFLGVTDVITEKLEVAVGGRCHGLAFSNGKLFVMFTDEPKLKIFNTYGQVLRTLEREVTGALLFARRPQHLCIRPDGETIYVNDVDSDHSVGSLTMEGAGKAVYKVNEAFLPQKICTDHHGNVFVCEYLNNVIHILTADCKFIKKIPIKKDKLDNNAWSISYSNETDQLFVSLWFCDKVKVYQLS